MENNKGKSLQTIESNENDNPYNTQNRGYQPHPVKSSTKLNPPKSTEKEDT